MVAVRSETALDSERMKSGEGFLCHISSLRLAVLMFLWMAANDFAFAADHKRMNVVLFLIDDLGWKDLGCQGSTYYQTPYIDQLAAEGVRFTDAYAACAVCTPTRAAIMTGKYPARTMMTNWTPDGRWEPQSPLREGRFLRALPLEEVTVAEALRQAGYFTAHIGKWHLGGPPFSMPEHHGFALNIAGNAHGAPGDYFFPYAGDWLIPTTDLRARWNVLPDGTPGEYLTDRLTDEAVRVIRQHRDEPFFLQFAHYGVHTPLQAKAELVGKYEKVPKAERQGLPTYAAMVESVDESVGRVMATLRDLKIDDHTAVIVTSDNGGFWKATDHAPLRGHKGTYWEGGIRVPLIIRWPGVARAAHVDATPVISTDLYPTMLAMAAIDALPNQHLDGMNLRPLVADSGELPPRSLFWHFPHYNDHPDTAPSGAIRSGNWKLIQTFDPPRLELYDFASDLGETVNLAETMPERTQTLLAELTMWRRVVGAAEMQPNPDFKPSNQKANPKGKRNASRSINGNQGLAEIVNSTSDSSLTKVDTSGQPNIVLLFVDDLGWNDVGYRNPKFETPNIDRLASEGSRRVRGPNSRGVNKKGDR